MVVYVPGTEETDPKKQNMALQQLGAAITTLQATSAVTNLATAGLATGGPITSTGTVTVPAAIQSDMVAATSTTVAVVPNVQKHHPAHPKAWAYVTQSAGTYTLAASFGVASILKNATGVVDVTLSTAFASTNFAVVVTNNTGGALASEIIASRSVTNVRIDLRAPNTTANIDGNFSMVAFGAQ